MGRILYMRLIRHQLDDSEYVDSTADLHLWVEMDVIVDVEWLLTFYIKNITIGINIYTYPNDQK